MNLMNLMTREAAAETPAARAGVPVAHLREAVAQSIMTEIMFDAAQGRVADPSGIMDDLRFEVVEGRGDAVDMVYGATTSTVDGSALVLPASGPLADSLANLRAFFGITV